MPVTLGLAAATGLGILAYTEVDQLGSFFFDVLWSCFCVLTDHVISML